MQGAANPGGDAGLALRRPESGGGRVSAACGSVCASERPMPARALTSDRGARHVARHPCVQISQRQRALPCADVRCPAHAARACLQCGHTAVGGLLDSHAPSESLDDPKQHVCSACTLSLSGPYPTHSWRRHRRSASSACPTAHARRRPCSPDRSRVGTHGISTQAGLN